MFDISVSPSLTRLYHVIFLAGTRGEFANTLAFYYRYRILSESDHNFSDEETDKVFGGERSRKLPFEIQAVAFRKLGYINAANSIEELRLPPSNRLEKLRGDRDGQWSIRVNDQWRICFGWVEHTEETGGGAVLFGDAVNVELTKHYK